MRITARNLSYNVDETMLINLFSGYGTVDSVKVVRDMTMNRSKGMAFIDMPDETEARHAISELNGYELEGKNMQLS